MECRFIVGLTELFKTFCRIFIIWKDISLIGWIKLHQLLKNTYILLDVLLCSIAEYFYELCRILTSP